MSPFECLSFNFILPDDADLVLCFGTVFNPPVLEFAQLIVPYLSLVGILSKIAAILANHAISIFAVSTFNTDYILIKSKNYQRGLEILEAAGYKIVD